MADKKPERKFEKKFDKRPEKSFGKKLSGEKVAMSLAEIGFFLFLITIIGAALIGFLVSPTVPAGLLHFLAKLLLSLKMIATIIVMIGIAIAVYSFIRLQEINGADNKELGLALLWEHERTEKNSRWERVEEYMRSQNPSDWKVAILEADNILGEIVERMGYRGETLGERMKAIEASDFPHLDLAWQAHKTRNAIAHQGGADYTLTRALAEQTINIYHRIFKELGYL